MTFSDLQALRERGVTGASAPGPGGPKGARRPLNKISVGVKRGENEQAEMGRLKTAKKATVNMNCMGG